MGVDCASEMRGETSDSAAQASYSISKSFVNYTILHSID